MSGRSESDRPNVWVVDDSPTDAERARRVLAGRYDVQVFPDGSAMLEHLASRDVRDDARSAAPDVLVLDWLMPGVSGIEVCRFLRARSAARSEMAILLLTMQTQTEQIVEGLAAGANDYLVKPYADPELAARVEALVRWNGLLERARRAEASLQDLLQHAPDPLISVDAANRVTYVNVEAEAALGQDRAALIGRSLFEALPALSRLPDGQLAQAARGARPLGDVEIGGQIFSPSIRSLPSDSPAGMTVALRNVTAHRQKESRRLDFYSIIAHDLRSPLSAMVMRTDLILGGRRGVLSADLVADLRKMEMQMKSLVALINDFLDLARMEESVHKMDHDRVDMKALIEQTVEEFRPLIDSTQQEVRIEARGEQPVVGDRRRLQQVVTNLVANAIKFTPSGGRLTVRARQSGPWCEVEVEDTGPGIPREVLPTLFQRYARAPSGSKEVGGTGLGLLIVREIVEAHGGLAGVDSSPGEGSRFWFRLPTAALADQPTAEAV